MKSLKQQKYVAIEAMGQREIHAMGCISDYATLCGLDGNDPHQDVQQATVALQASGDRITCPDCRAIWQHAKSYRSSDFTPSPTDHPIFPARRKAHEDR